MLVKLSFILLHQMEAQDSYHLPHSGSYTLKKYANFFGLGCKYPPPETILFELDRTTMGSKEKYANFDCHFWSYFY